MNKILFSKGEYLTERGDDVLKEASGIDISYNFPGFFWLHNDSGDHPAVYLMDENGSIAMTVRLKGAKHRDWEDLATVSENGRGILFIGDIGDNRAQRDFVTIYKVPEPKVIQAEIIVENFEKMHLQYREGPRDSETLMYDHGTKELVQISKREDNCLIYHYPFTVNDKPLEIQASGSINLTQFTGGDIHDDGRILLKNYNSVFYWGSSEEKSWNRLRVGPESRIPYKPEPQGEAVCWWESGFLTITEAYEKSPQVLILYKSK